MHNSEIAVANKTRINVMVTRAGSRNPRESAWAIAEYKADHNTASGYVFYSATDTRFPSKSNYAELETYDQLVYGRPVAGVNAPFVEGMVAPVSSEDRWILAGKRY